MLTIRLARIALALAAFTLFVGCRIPPSNPFDPETPIEQQAKASVRGRIALVNPGADDATIVRDLSAARVGLLDVNGRRVERDNAPLALALSDVDADGGTFALDELLPGTYALIVDNLGLYAAPALTDLNLVAGAAVDLGELVFTVDGDGGPGPGSIAGTVALDVDDAGAQREVVLFKRTNEGVLEVARTIAEAAGAEGEGAFAFAGLGGGNYAVVASATGFTNDHRLDIEVGEGGSASLTHVFDGDDALRLFPVNAIVLPQESATVRIDEGEVYVRDDVVTLTIRPFGGVTGMRLSTRPDFTDGAGGAGGGGAPLPFEPIDVVAQVALPGGDGDVTVFAQFIAASPEGNFTFTSDVIETRVTRDVTPPEVSAAFFPGLAVDAAGVSLANIASGASPGLHLELVDATSPINGYAVAVSDVDAAPAEDTLTISDVTSFGGLVRIDDIASIGSDGARFVFVFARDRAGNISLPRRVAVRLDTSLPELALDVDNASAGGILESRLAELRFDVAGAAAAGIDLPVEMQLGTAPLAPASEGDPEAFPGDGVVSFIVPAPAFLHGSDVTFAARLIDANGNSVVVESNELQLSLLSRVAGNVAFEGVPEIAADHAGAVVRILDASGAELAGAVTATNALGDYSLSGIVEGSATFIDVQRDGWAGARVRLPTLPTLAAADPATALDDITVPLARGTVSGRVLRSDLAGDPAAHAASAVKLVIVDAVSGQSDDAERAFDDTTVTGADGSFTLRDVPVTRLDEVALIEATRDEYGSVTSTLVVAGAVVNVVNPDANGLAIPLLLPKNVGDFDVCETGAGAAACVAGLRFFNDASVRVRLRDVVDVAEIRAQARVPFAAGDGAPAFVTFPPGNDHVVDIAGADGPVEIFVQVRKSDGSTSGVLSSTIVLDTVAPTIESLERPALGGAFDARFSRVNFSDLVVAGDVGAGAVGVDIAPLASTRASAFADDGSAIPSAPPAGATSCAFPATSATVTCRVTLPEGAGGPGTVDEALHRLAAWACDAAGNCSAPSESFVIHDVTAPSSAHGAGFALTGGIDVGPEHAVRSPLYGIRVDVGAAEDASGNAVVDESDAAVADVFAARFSFTQTAADAQVRALDPAPVAGSARSDVTVPPVPAVDGTYRVFAQLFDAAGNFTLVEPNAFSRDLRLDTTAPVVAFVVAGGADVVSDGVVAVDIIVPAGGEVPTRAELAADGGLFDPANVVTLTFPLDPAGETFTLPDEGDKSYTVFARVFDAAGNVVERADVVTLDTTAPDISLATCLSCTNTGGQLFTSAASAQLSVIANDGAGGGVVSLEIDVEDAANSANFTTSVVLFTGSASVALFANTENIVTVRAVDRGGNVTAVASSLSLVIAHDDNPPALTLVELADGDAVTQSTQVALRVSASDAETAVTRMRVAPTLDFTGVVATELRAVDFVDLAGGDGAKQVCVQVEDAAGNVTAGCDSVTLDRAAPSGTVNILAAVTNAASVDVDLVYASDTAEVAFAPGALACNGAAYASASGSPQRVNVALDGGDGTARVFACFRDSAGNFTATPASDSVVVDRTAPAISVLVDGGAEFTLDDSVGAVVTVSPASDVATGTGLALSINTPIACASATYVPFNASTTLTLPQLEQAHTIFACVRDPAGNVSNLATDAVFFDRFAPTGSVVVEGGATITRLSVVGADVTRSADVTQMAIATGALNCGTAAFEAFASVRTVNIGAGVDGLKTVSVCLKDAAGRTALFSDDITLDRAAPIASISINGGAPTTSSPTVNVSATFDADAAQMALSAAPLDCASAVYGAPAALTQVDLLTSNGFASVFACFRDLAGNTTAATDSIFVEQAASGTLLASINGGAPASTSRNVTINLVAPADANQMKVQEAATLDCANPVGYVAFQSSSALTLAAGGAAPAEGVRTVSACVTTTGGETLFAQDSILLDTFLPSGSVSINSAAAVTNNALVTLSIVKNADSNDVNQIGVSSVSTSACASFEAFVSARSFTLGGADGSKDVFVCLKDDAGNTTIVTDNIALDRAAPSPVIVNVADFSTATTVDATLTFPAGDTTQVAVAEGALDCASTSSFVPAAGTVQVSLSASEGAKVIVACFKDAAGNTSQASDVTTLDLVAPSGSVLIAGGAAATTSANVVLTINASADVDRMAIIEQTATPNCDTATYIAFVQQPNHTLASGDGNKTVHVCLQDRAGRKAAAIPDTIRLDQGAPDGSIVVNNGDNFTNRRDVVVAVTRNAGSEDAVEMAVAEGALVCNAANLQYVAFAPSAPLTLSSGDALKTISLCLRDTAGNVSTTTRTDTITLDTAPPSAATVRIASDAAFTTTATVTLNLTFPADVDGVAVANDGLDCSSASYGTPSATITGFALTPGDGTKTVAGCFRDRARNTFLFADTITLDTVAPTTADSSLIVNAGAQFSTSRNVTLSFTAPADVKQVAVSESALDCATATYTALVTPQTFNIASAGDGNKTINACLKEDAGRTVAVSDVINLDTTAPTVTAFTLNGVASPVTNNPVVTVALTAAADTVALAIANGSLDCTTASYGAFASTFQHTVAGASPVTVSLCIKDAAGNVSTTGANTRTVTLDNTAPSGSVSINTGAASTTTRNVTLTLDTVPAESGLQRAIANDAIDCATATFAALGTVPASVAHTLSAGDGTKTVAVCFKDAAGNISSATDTIALDTVDPVGTVAISDPEANADGFANTVNVTVALTLPGEDAATALMAVREATTLNCADAALVYEGFASTKAVTLTATQGLKTISTCFKDAAGRVTPAAALAQDTITLDTQAPAGALSILEGSIAGGTHFVNTTSVTATIATGDADVVGLAVSTSALNCSTVSYGPFSATAPLTLPVGEGAKTLNACLRDAAGLRTLLSKSVTLDTTAPTGTIVVDGGADYTADRDVSVQVTSTEVSPPLRLKVPASDCAPPFNIAAFDGDETRTVTINGSEGTREIGACLADPAGNVAFLSGAINLDLTAPVGISAACASCIADETGALFTRGFDTDGNGTPESVALLGDVEAVDPNANGFVESVRVRFDITGDGDFVDTVSGVSETQTQAYDSFVTVTLPTADASHTLHLFFVDAAGNESAELDFNPALAGIQGLAFTLDRTAPSAATTFTLTGRLGDDSTSTARTVTQNVLVAFGLPVGHDVTRAVVTENASFTGLDPRALSDVLASPFVLSGGDATKTVRALLIDHAGNATTLTATPSIILDSTPPVILSFALTDTTSGSATFTDSGTVTATQTVISEAGLEMRHVTPDNPADAEAFAAFSGSVAVVVENVAAQQGAKSAVLQVRDLARNTVAANAVIELDNTAPSAPSISVDGGAPFTRSVSVLLTLAVTGATEMRTRTDGAFDAEQFVPVASTAAALLPSGDCPTGVLDCKTVCAEFRDSAGNTSSTVCDSITLDGTPPAVPVITNAPGAVVSATAFTLALAGEPADAFFGGYEIVTDPGDNGVFSEETPLAGGGPPQFALTLTAPTSTDPALASTTNLIRVRAFDDAGNRSVESTLAVAVDPVAPATPVPTAATGAPVDDVVNADTFAAFFDALNTSANDANFSHYEIARQSLSQPAPAFTPTGLVDGLIFTLEQGNGAPCASPCLNRLRIRARDKAGNTSGTVEIQIEEDSTFPTQPRFTPRGARISAVVAPMGLEELSFDNGATSEAAAYEVVGGDIETFTEVAAVDNFSFTLDRRDFTHQLCIRGKDAAGNVSTTDCVAVEQRSTIVIDGDGVDEENPAIFGDVVVHDDQSDGAVLTEVRGLGTTGNSNRRLPRVDGERNNFRVVDIDRSGLAHVRTFNVDGVGAFSTDDFCFTRRCGGQVGSVSTVDIAGDDVVMAGVDFGGGGTRGVWATPVALCNDAGAGCGGGPAADATRLTDPARDVELCRDRFETGVRVHGGVVVWCETNASAVDEIHRVILTAGIDTVIATNVAPGFESPHQPFVSSDGLYWASGADLCRIDATAAVGTPLDGCPVAQRVNVGVDVGQLWAGDGTRTVFTVGSNDFSTPEDAMVFDRAAAPGAQLTQLTDDILEQEDIEIWRDRIVYADRQRFSNDVVMRDLTEGTWVTANSAIQAGPRTDGRFIVWGDTRNLIQLFAVDLGPSGDDLAGAVEFEVTPPEEILAVGDALFSVANGLVAYAVQDGSGGADVFVQDLASGARTLIENGPTGAEAVELNEDASRVAWFNPSLQRVRTVALSGITVVGSIQSVGGAVDRARRMGVAGDVLLFEAQNGGPTALACATVGSTASQTVAAEARGASIAPVPGFGLVATWGGNNSINMCTNFTCPAPPGVVSCSTEQLASDGGGSVELPKVSTSGYITWRSNQSGDGFGQVAIFDIDDDVRYRIAADFGVDGDAPVFDSFISGKRVVWSGFAFGTSDIFTAVLAE